MQHAQICAFVTMILFVVFDLPALAQDPDQPESEEQRTSLPPRFRSVKPELQWMREMDREREARAKLKQENKQRINKLLFPSGKVPDGFRHGIGEESAEEMLRRFHAEQKERRVRANLIFVPLLIILIGTVLLGPIAWVIVFRNFIQGRKEDKQLRSIQKTQEDDLFKKGLDDIFSGKASNPPDTKPEA